MKSRNPEEILGAIFDGEHPESELDRVLEEHPDSKSYLQSLEVMRDGAQSAAEPPKIEDGQFNSFMAGIEEGLEKQPSPWRGRLVWASMTAATLVLALSIFSMITPPPAPVDATEVDFVSTELSGATTEWSEEDGVVTVWINPAKEDI